MSDKAKRAKITTIPLRRPYKEALLVLLMFGGSAIFFYVKASNNDRGLILNGLIEMGPEAADWFYAIFGIFSAALALAGFFGAWRISQIKNFHIELGRKEMTFPSAPVFRTLLATVPYDRIESVEIVGQGNASFVTIRESDRAYSIPSRWMAEGWTAQQILEEVIARVRTLRTKGTAELAD